ncbi:MAG TPA: CoA-binding protein, partial [Bacteroidetes bacterium]|nr:CoA-binding protein [Bacteroidota bacterium]
SPENIQVLLDAVGLPRVHEQTYYSKNELVKNLSSTEYPVVMKVVGPVHKSDVGGVSLNIKDDESMLSEFDRMMNIDDASGVLVQPMLSGHELYAGVTRELKFGHIIMFGLGGIFIEVFKDVRSVLAPAGEKEVLNEVRQLRGYKLFTGVRGKPGIDEQKFADIISRLSLLVELAPEITEMDLNPLLAEGDKITAIDARIRIEK